MSKRRPRPSGLPRLSVGRVLVLLAVLVAFLGATALLTTITTSVWPGEATVVARWACDDDHPDAFVVVDTNHTPDGTSYDFSLYCANAGGDAIDVGWAGPFIDLWILHTLVLVLVLVALVVRIRFRRRRRGAPGTDGAGPEPASTPPPPVDPISLA